MEVSYKAAAEIRKTQRELLDLLEVELANSPAWPTIRLMVIKLFDLIFLQRGGL